MFKSKKTPELPEKNKLTDDNNQCITGTADSTIIMLCIAVGKFAAIIHLFCVKSLKNSIWIFRRYSQQCLG